MHEGRMVIEKVAAYIRDTAGAEAMREWAARPVQGAAARAVLAGEVAPSGMSLYGYRKPIRDPMFPEGTHPRHEAATLCPDRSLWQMRVYSGGSWTTFRREQGVRREEHPPQGEGGLAQAERCPLCRAGRGDGRHVALNCAGPGLPEIRATLFDEAERILREADDPSSPRSVASLRHPRGLRGQGADGAEERWPLLTQLGWLRPTTGEAEICAGLGQRRPAELGYDLGYRGILPRALAKALG